MKFEWQWIQELLRTRAAESGYLEFKRELPGPRDEDKKEFLKDVSAFANAHGGTLVFGIDEENGEAASVAALQVDDPDQELSRLRSIIRDGLAPRLASLQIDWVLSRDGRERVLVADVRPSPLAPHIVTLRNHSRFYRRSGTDNHQLDVHEIRDAFLQAALSQTQATRYRDERVSIVRSRSGSVRLRPGPVLIIHCVPIRRPGIDFAQAVADRWRRNPGIWTARVGHGSQSTVWSIDGFTVHPTLSEEAEDRSLFTYALAGRDGSAEIASWCPARGASIEKSVREGLSLYRCALNAVGIDTPFALFITLTGVEGMRLTANQQWDEQWQVRPNEIDRDEILLPEITVYGVSETDESVNEKLDTVFRVLWQASGFASRDAAVSDA